MALATRRHAKEKAANDAVIRLEKDVQAQAAAVERIGNRLIEVGASDFLKERLRGEEAKLRDLRHALAKAASRTTPLLRARCRWSTCWPSSSRSRSSLQRTQAAPARCWRA
jgi:hypothetical protein